MVLVVRKRKDDAAVWEYQVDNAALTNPFWNFASLSCFKYISALVDQSRVISSITTELHVLRQEGTKTIVAGSGISKCAFLAVCFSWKSMSYKRRNLSVGIQTQCLRACAGILSPSILSSSPRRTNTAQNIAISLSSSIVLRALRASFGDRSRTNSSM